jgi:hypothetical protein
MLRQHAGWTKNSKMPSVYYHFYENEAVDELYKAKGYLQKDDIYDSNPIGLKNVLCVDTIIYAILGKQKTTPS